MISKRLPYLLAYYAVLFGVGIMAACLGPAMPALAQKLGTDLKSVSVLLALRPLGYMAGTYLCGRLMARLPGHRVLAGGVALAALGLAIIPHSPSLGLLTLAVCVMGLADGVLDVGSNTLLPWVFGKESGPYFNGLHFVFGVGALVTPLIMVAAMRHSLELAFSLLALLFIPLLPWLWRLPSPRHDHDEAAADPRNGKEQGALLWLVAALFFCYGGAEVSFGSWIFSYARATGLADEAQAGRINSLYWGALSLGRLAAVWVALRASVAWMLGVDVLGTLLSLGLILLLPNSATVLWLGAAGTGIFMASFFPSLLAAASAKLSPSGDGKVAASTTAKFFLGSSLGAILQPWLCGQGFESRGPAWALEVVFVATLVQGALLGMLGWKLRTPK